uniref:Uncharacterized protein n=1 Tax=Ceratitis capitata TaxID=7213 RepID=W8C4W2_CERCA
MSEELKFIYNTRLRSRSLSIDFYSRLSNAFVNDFNRNSENVEENLALNDYDDGDDSRDLDYVLDGDASDVENELVIELNEIEILDSDEEIEDEEQHATASVIQREATTESFFGKDGTEWKKEQTPSRTRQHNIMRFRACPKLSTIYTRKIHISLSI